MIQNVFPSSCSPGFLNSVPFKQSRHNSHRWPALIHIAVDRKFCVFINNVQVYNKGILKNKVRHYTCDVLLIFMVVPFSCFMMLSSTLTYFKVLNILVTNIDYLFSTATPP